MTTGHSRGRVSLGEGQRWKAQHRAASPVSRGGAGASLCFPQPEEPWLDMRTGRCKAQRKRLEWRVNGLKRGHRLGWKTEGPVHYTLAPLSGSCSVSLSLRGPWGS